MLSGMAAPADRPRSEAASRIPASPVLCLRMYERPRILEILRADSGGRPECERGHGAGRVVAGILRKGACALYEDIRYIPALQIPVDHAVAGIGSHDGAAADVRRLILRYIVRSFARLLHNLSRAHSLDDLGVAVGEKLAHLELVLMEIVRQPDQRPAEAILVGRVE